MSMVGLAAGKADAIPDRLSGGEIQRACIALAIALKPDLVILDEPTSALDASLKGQIISLLKDLKQQFASSYLFITHDINQASSICENFAVLYAGRIVEKGSREAVLESPRHPYTRKLLECVEIGRLANTPAFIRGEPPILQALPTGCSFHPRCDLAMTICREKIPALEDRAGGHFAACHMEKG
jgi:oligopeptide/dipeptide ABC transporter ATP-binding protein